MSTPNTEERKRRVEQDTNALDETVYHVDRNNGVPAYHDNVDCGQINKETKHCTREEAQEKGLYPCKICVFEFDKTPSEKAAGQKGILEQLIEEGKADEHMGVDWE